MLTARAEDRGRGAALAILALAMVVAAGALIYWGRGAVMIGDDLFYAQRLSDDDLGHAILHSNLYLLALPMALYKAMFEVFGIGSYLPYRLAAIILALLCATLFYSIAGRRIGSLLALAPTILLLLFGSGWEVLITGARIPSLIAIASGLAAILLLEREDAGGDAWAAVLLCVSATSHPAGLGFLAAAAACSPSGPRRDAGSPPGWFWSRPRCSARSWSSFSAPPTTFPRTSRTCSPSPATPGRCSPRRSRAFAASSRLRSTTSCSPKPHPWPSWP